jgi:predicted deacylase
VIRRRRAFAIGPIEVKPGTRREVGLPITRLVTGAEVTLPVAVLHGRFDGPTVWIDAAIHGDEVGGVEIVRRVLTAVAPRLLHGTLLAVPIVNVHGFMVGERYLPDRRDLNRSFPGSARGSLASRIAHLMVQEVVAKSEVGIDLHTGSDHRTNLPQIRADLDDPRTRELATAFGAPVMVHSSLRDGSLRQAARDEGAVVLVYEGGEAWRFDEFAVSTGVTGVLRILATMEMIDLDVPEAPTPRESRKTGWVRASRTGIVHVRSPLGAEVADGDEMGQIYDSFGKRLGRIRANRDGIVIGRTEAPLVNRGDALVHIAEV